MPEDESCGKIKDNDFGIYMCYIPVLRIKDILKGHILVFHTPHSDLKKLQLYNYRARLIRDVSVYVPLRESLVEELRNIPT